MAKRSVSPIGTWIFWSVLLLGVFVTVTWEYFVKGFTADTSYISWLILAFFAYGFISSALVAIYLQAEHKSLKVQLENERVVDATASDISALLDAAMERVRRGDRIELKNLISAYGTKLSSRVYNLSVISNMLITVGLLGTVLGLLGTVTGLESVLQANSADFAEIKAGMNRTVSGMGTAFYTTFFGALLGGVVLKVLSAEMKKSAAVLVSDALRFSELYIVPEFQRSATDALTELEAKIFDLDEQLGSLSNSFGSAVDTIDSKQTVLSSGLEQLAETVARTSDQATERTGQLVNVISGTLETTARQADERLQAFTSTVEQFNRESSARANALVESIAKTTQNSAEQAAERFNSVMYALEQNAEKTNERAATLVEAMDGSLKATNARADERLQALTSALEQANAEAAGQSGALAQAIADSIEAANARADERLSASTATLGQSVQETSQHAAQQLEAVSASVQTNIEETNRRADERMEAMLGKISDMIRSADQNAAERLELLTDAIGKMTAETSRLADERLETMIRAVDHATLSATAKADAQLAGFVENVERSIDSSRMDAEQRLNTKASDLAGKLNEAASMLSGLVSAVVTPDAETANDAEED